MTEILMYHHVEPGPLDPAPLNPESYVTPGEFARQLDRLIALGYRTLSLREAFGNARDEKTRPRSVVLTFDDACGCFARHAAPLLRERDMTATVFAVSDLIGRDNAWDRAAGERAEALLDAEQLQELADCGFEIGCHSASHADLTTLDDDRLLAETVGAKNTLEAAIDREVTTFCYPYGHCDERSMTAVRSAGFRAAVGIVDHGITARDHRWALPREAIRPGESPFELRLKAGGAYRWWRRLPRLGLLSALRRRSRNE